MSKPKLNHRQLLHFYELTKAIQAQKSMKSAAQKACHLMGKILKIERVVIFHYHKEQKNLTLIGEYDQDPNHVSALGERHSLSAHPLDRKIIGGKTVLVNDLQKISATPQKVLKKVSVHSFLGLPLKSGKEIFGTICFDRTKPKKSFSKKDIRLAHLMTEEISDTLYRFHLIKKNKRLLNFSRRYLSWLLGKDILEKLDEDKDFHQKLEEKNLAIVVGDFKDSTAFSLKVPVETVIETFSTLYDLSSKIAKKHSGRLHETRGDEVLLTFPNPSDACLATKKLNKACQLAFSKYSLSLSFGIHYGSVNVGFIGGKYYKNYQVIGSTINVAAHIQKQTPSNQIYISKDVKDLLNDKISSTPRKIKVKHQTKPTTIYSLN